MISSKQGIVRNAHPFHSGQAPSLVGKAISYLPVAVALLAFEAQPATGADRDHVEPVAEQAPRPAPGPVPPSAREADGDAGWVVLALDPERAHLLERLPAETRARLERLRRGK